ncbi:unnamed protein product [Allacma fusca]|uniref:HTH CENPB-type domain-containing protein n=1 Tax=Allacma fusca TaxID=39272 RepID=A0A8J2L7K1_9HEXA|nr:unnamed protein product [Allacma fusca]
MVYNYVCKFSKTTGEEVRKAIYLVTELQCSHRKAAEATGVTRSVLERYLKKDDSEIPEVLSQGSFKPVSSKEQEKQIVAYCHDLANKFYAMTRKSLRMLAFNLAEENKLTHPFRNVTAGDEWISSFLIRHHTEFSVRTGTPTTLIRITSFTKSAVYRCFDHLEMAIADKNYSAATIFNADETGVSIVPDNDLGRPNRHVFIDSDFADTKTETPTTAAQDTNPAMLLPEQHTVNPLLDNNEQVVMVLGSSSLLSETLQVELVPNFVRNDTVRSLVPYYGSSTDDDEEDDDFHMISVGVQVNLLDFIHFTDDEIRDSQQETDVVLPISNITTGQLSQQRSDVSPRDLYKPGTSTSTMGSKRKPRAKGSSELVTSKDYIQRLQAMEEQKRKKNSSDSEEGVTTRSKTKAASRVLRSNSRSGSSSQAR